MGYLSFNDAMQARFGCKVYRLSLAGGMTCPNRDGTIGSRGCIFCGADGSGAFAQAKLPDIARQLQEAKKRIAHKARNAKYVAYFQNYTNTYAPVSVLEPLFFDAIEPQDIVALSVATRPDCLGNDVLELLERLNAVKPVWVELGLQTIHPQTTAYIRRGYDLACFETAMAELKKRGIEVIVHLILGLPGETDEMIRQSAEYVGQSGADGVKLHLLHVLKNTDLAADYAEGMFETLELEHYISLVEDCLRLLPPHMVIHRMTGDGAKKDLIAPMWSADKKRVLNAMRAAFERDALVQGEWICHTKD